MLTVTQYRNRVSVWLMVEFGIFSLSELTQRQRDYVNHCHKAAAPVDDCIKGLGCMLMS